MRKNERTKIECIRCGAQRTTAPYLALGLVCLKCGRPASLADLQLEFKLWPPKLTIGIEMSKCVRAHLNFEPKDGVTLGNLADHLRHTHTNWHELLRLVPRGDSRPEYLELKAAMMQLIAAKFYTGESPLERAFQRELFRQRADLAKKLKSTALARG